MAFQYTSEIQARIAAEVFSVPYASLTTVQKTQVDATWASGTLTGGAAYEAQIQIGSIAQYFEQAATSPELSLPQPAWNRLLICLTTTILAKTWRPDYYDRFRRDYEEAVDWVIDTYTPTTIDSASIAYQPLTVPGLRSYVAIACAKRKESGVNQGSRRRLFTDTKTLDAHIRWAVNFLWNFRFWTFRAREVTLIVTPLAITGATWTESTKLLTATNQFTQTVTAGQPVYVTGGTGATAGPYAANVQTTDDTLSLSSSIGSAANGQTDIACTVVGVTMDGLMASETFDAIASSRFYFEGNFRDCELIWLDKTRAPQQRAQWGVDTGFPRYFRTQVVNQNTVWHFYPIPDAAYRLYGTVYVATPDISTLALINTAIGKFPAEFGTGLMDLVLARVLRHHNASDANRAWSDAMEQCDTLGLTYSDQGMPTRDTTIVRDVYNDYEAML